MSRVIDYLEPEARSFGASSVASFEACCTFSIAISLKRIADRLPDTQTPGGFASLEDMAFQIGQAFERGRRAT